MGGVGGRTMPATKDPFEGSSLSFHTDSTTLMPSGDELPTITESLSRPSASSWQSAARATERAIRGTGGEAQSGVASRFDHQQDRNDHGGMIMR